MDHVALVHSLAGECGITKEEWLRQNLGIELNSETPTCWTQITFWEKVVCITIPNFPPRGCSETIDHLWRYIDFFTGRGFSSLPTPILEPRCSQSMHV